MTRALSLLLVMTLLTSGCSLFRPPDNPENICDIFHQKWGWERHAKKAEKRWGSPVPVMMAIMYQESSFVSNAKPPRVRFLGIPLWWRKSSSYGYSQAKDDTWRWYEQSVGRNADRDDFDDAIDFIGWYNHMSHRRIGLSHDDAYSMYLAYHEGHGGFRSGSYKGKDWLLRTAARVRDRAATYRAQWQRCD